MLIGLFDTTAPESFDMEKPLLYQATAGKPSLTERSLTTRRCRVRQTSSCRLRESGTGQ